MLEACYEWRLSPTLQSRTSVISCATCPVLPHAWSRKGISRPILEYGRTRTAFCRYRSAWRPHRHQNGAVGCPRIRHGIRVDCYFNYPIEMEFHSLARIFDREDFSSLHNRFARLDNIFYDFSFWFQRQGTIASFQGSSHQSLLCELCGVPTNQKSRSRPSPQRSPPRRHEWNRDRSLVGVIATIGSREISRRSAAADAPVELWATPA